MLDIYEIQNRLIFHEGLKLNIYKDKLGKKTIGVGRCIETNPLTYEEKKAVGDIEHGITKNAAMFLLRNDIERCIEECDKNIICWRNLNKERKYALLDMCFQLGVKGLLKFKKMLKALQNKDYEEASRQCLDSEYGKQTPKRAKRIANLIKTGVWVI